ncbi:MAG: 2,3-bisphosphoglycerate-independent phosphoglycerate mutase [Proteobacteria bacterium]|nr:2,3-bisphosphoglycerate-independent phosphoglycerate mutase [Pseudomonadota bacterium]
MRPALLCIIDGFGIAPPSPGNAVTSASTPNLNSLLASHPSALLLASGEAVGLPAMQVGNSEVGHLTIGSGRVTKQELLLINQAAENGELATHPKLTDIVEGAQCHILGIISDGGVHGHIQHIIALAQALKSRGVQIFLHAISDGRDCSPKSILKYLDMLKDAGLYQDIATLTGRYYAMDRDNNFERTELAYKAIAYGEGQQVSSPEEVARRNYEHGVSDEFFHPVIIGNYQGMHDGDYLICSHYRGERMRQLLSLLLLPDEIVAHLKTPPKLLLKGIKAFGMVSYGQKLDKVMQTIFTKPILKNTMSEVMANAGYKQLKVAETEKYAHVTYFLNGGKEEPWVNEDRVLIHSPKVATYDLAPQMSAIAVTEAVQQGVAKQQYKLICVNYANADMVGHTGNIQAGIAAVETIDQQLGNLMSLATQYGLDLWITADHGNIDMMLGPDGQPATSHSMNPVPLIYYGASDIRLRSNGSLSDVAPTILAVMGITSPLEMTGKSLVI